MPRYLLLAMLPLALPACKTRQSTAALSAATIVTRLRNQLTATRTYRAKLRSTITPSKMFSKAEKVALPSGRDRLEMVTSTSISAALPDRMRMVIEMNKDETRMRTELVYDGKKAWSFTRMQRAGDASKNPPSSQEHATFLDQKRLAKAGAPFDLDFNFRGHGLSEGEDLWGTILDFLDRYDIAPSLRRERCGDGDCYLLEGRLNTDKTLAKIFADKKMLGVLVSAWKEGSKSGGVGSSMSKLLGDMLRWTSHLKLWVSTRDYLPRKFALGDGKTILMREVIEKLEPGVPMPAKTFAVSAARRKSAKDMTSLVLETRKKMAEVLKDKKAVEQTKARIRQELKSSKPQR